MQQDKRKWPQVVQRRFRLGSRKDFAEKVVRHWNTLLTEVVEAPALEICKKRVDVTLEDMG